MTALSRRGADSTRPTTIRLPVSRRSLALARPQPIGISTAKLSPSGLASNGRLYLRRNPRKTSRKNRLVLLFLAHSHSLASHSVSFARSSGRFQRIQYNIIGIIIIITTDREQ